MAYGLDFHHSPGFVGMVLPDRDSIIPIFSCSNHCNTKHLSIDCGRSAHHQFKRDSHSGPARIYYGRDGGDLAGHCDGSLEKLPGRG